MFVRYSSGHRSEDLAGAGGGKILNIESLFTAEEEYSFNGKFRAAGTTAFNAGCVSPK